MLPPGRKIDLPGHFYVQRMFTESIMGQPNGKDSRRRNKPHTGRRLAERLALEVMAECRFNRDTVINREFCNTGFQACRRKVSKLRAESQGLLLSYGASYADSERGRTALYEVHGGTWMGKYDSGREILRQGAATAVMAVVMDLVESSHTSAMHDPLGIIRRGENRAET